jgi:UDP-N-acetylmuramate-alanine ligase
VYGHLNGKLPEKIREIVESVRLDPYGGRMTLLENAKGVKIIADYAHEKKSLATVAALAKSLIDINGSVIGVVRLAYDRTDELLHETGRVIGEAYDSVVVYDKIDGFFRKAKEKPQSARFQQVEGRTSQVVYDGVKQTNENVRRIVREDQAIKYAAEIAKAGDIVVIIVNDNIPQSIELIKKYFKADFI